MLHRRRELAGSEGVEGAETGVEFRGGQAALAVEPAEKIGGGTLSFERIAFEAGGNQVAIGVAPRTDAGHDVVKALDARIGAAQTIKAMAAFAEGDGLAQGAGLEEVEGFEVGGCTAVASDEWRERVAGKPPSGGKPGRRPRISSGRSTLITWPALLRRMRRSAPRTTRRRTDSRTGPVLTPMPRASQGMEKRSWSRPSRRLWRMRCE